MTEIIEIKVPDIGDFDAVELIEILVNVGDRIEAEDSLVTLESDKASMEIPTPKAGIVKNILVNLGDMVSEGSALVQLEVIEQTDSIEIKQETTPVHQAPVPENQDKTNHIADIYCEVLVLGAGPGGYTAAFRSADLGKKTVMVEYYDDLGGVCLNVGCIPSKALLHAADVINEAAEMEATMGVKFSKPKIDLEQMRAGKEKVVKRLTGGLAALSKQRKVQIVQGLGEFTSPKHLSVLAKDGSTTLIEFENAIIACGSSSVKIPVFPMEDERLIDSTGALALPDIPKRMLIIGGGIIGLEMATVYSTLGSQIDIVELQNALIPGCDKDLVRPMQKRLAKKVNTIMLETKVSEINSKDKGLEVLFEGKNAPDKAQLYDRVLLAVGRSPNGKKIAAGMAGVHVDERGFIPVDKHMRTNVAHIFAIGDVVGNPMLAHKATNEGKVAAEVIAGLPSLFDPMTIPSVAYTDPEVAWMGLTETDAKQNNIAYEKGVFPWAASGRALGVHREEGLTKLLFDPETKRILGAGIVGVNAGELIGETVLALEMGADAEDIGLTIHPHPTLNESVGMAAEVAEGSITDIMPPKKRR